MTEPQPLAQKCAIQFEKAGRARYFSHHDLMRLFERGLRRADLPVRMTEGFNPRPRLVFPHPLGLGVASVCEEIEIELAVFRPLDTILETLRPEVEPTLKLRRIVPLPGVRKGRIVRSCMYRLSGWEDPAVAALREAVGALLAAESLEVERGHGKKRRALDIRPYLADLEVDGAGCLLTLHHTQQGAGRADEIAALLADATGVDRHGIRIEKIHMAFAGERTRVRPGRFAVRRTSG